MELLQLRYYAAVVQEGSINAAAKKLGMTQPPVSMQIRLLERELGCPLFERGNRKIRLTDEGKIFYEQTLKILSMTESAAVAVADCRNSESGTLRIGVVSSLAEGSAEKWFKGFSVLHPGINYELNEGTTYQLLDRLGSRILDVALVRTPFSARGFASVSLAPESMILIGTGDLLRPFDREMSLRQVSELPLIIYRRWQEVVDRVFAGKGLKPRVICTADDARTCVSWAGTGLGAAIVPAGITGIKAFSSLESRAIRGLAASTAITLVTNEGGCDTAVGRDFVRYFREINGV